MATLLLAIIISSVGGDSLIKGHRYYEVTDSSSSPRIHIFLKNRRNSKKILGYLRRGTFYLNRWFGPCPFEELTVVEETQQSARPGLIYISGKDDYIIRRLEEEIIEELAFQWSYPLSDPGFAIFTTYRYLETVYGRQGGSKIPIIELDQGLDCHYKYQIMMNRHADSHYLTIIKGAYVFKNLEAHLGSQAFDAMMTAYLKHVRRESVDVDFWRFIDDYTGQDLARIYFYFLNNPGFCDLYVKNKRIMKKDGRYIGEVEIGNLGNLMLPYKVLFKTKSESLACYAKKETTFTFDLSDKPVIVIDPDFSVLEKSKSNNRTPAPVILTYKINRNILERYPIYFLPYLWYSEDEGIASGGMIQGGLPVFPEELGTRNLIFARSYYAWRKKRPVLEFTYSTPLDIFRLESEGRFDANENMLKLRFKKKTSYFGLFGSDLFDTTDLETRDFEIARQFSLGVGISQSSSNLDLRYGILDHRFLKVTARIMEDRVSRLPIAIRLFAGGIFGDPPVQDKIFLSGSLYPSIIGRIITQRKGTLSGQEHLNYEGGPWLVGYYGQHRKGKLGYGANLKLNIGPLFFFGDLGDVADDRKALSYRYDLGVGIRISKILIQFPFYVSRPQSGEDRLAFRWLVSL